MAYGEIDREEPRPSSVNVYDEAQAHIAKIRTEAAQRCAELAKQADHYEKQMVAARQAARVWAELAGVEDNSEKLQAQKEFDYAP